MFAELASTIAATKRLVAGLDPAALRAVDAAKLLDAFIELERAAAAGKTLVAARAAESRAWQREGHRTAAGWLAAKTDAPTGAALGTIETSARLPQLGATLDALRRGEISPQRATEVASAAAAAPDREQELLEVARTGSTAELRERSRQARIQAHPDESARYEAVRRARYLRHWTDGDGAVRLDARLTPDAGAALLAAIDDEKDRIFHDARRLGRQEPYAAYAADALVALATRARGEGAGSPGEGAGSGRRGAASRESGAGPRAMVHVLVDHRALVRGSTEGGEICEIPGIGPIPVATARALASDAVLKVLVTDGVDVRAVAHAGRTIPAHLRTALEARDLTCVVSGCDVRHGLQIDHRVPFALGGPTTLSNLSRLCSWHHHLKTHCGYRLEGEPGRWRWVTPDEQEGARDARPPPAA